MKLGEDRVPIITHYRRLVHEGRGRMGTEKESQRTEIIVGNILKSGQRVE